MNKRIFLFILFLTCRICSAQNLVINPGFEDTISCPSGQSALWAVSSWFNPTGASPDYFNQCASPNSAGVPDNFYTNLHMEEKGTAVLYLQMLPCLISENTLKIL